jgi:4-alpha-glucanotransferase
VIFIHWYQLADYLQMLKYLAQNNIIDYETVTKAVKKLMKDALTSPGSHTFCLECAKGEDAISYRT